MTPFPKTLHIVSASSTARGNERGNGHLLDVRVKTVSLRGNLNRWLDSGKRTDAELNLKTRPSISIRTGSKELPGEKQGREGEKNAFERQDPMKFHPKIKKVRSEEGRLRNGKNREDGKKTNKR